MRSGPQRPRPPTLWEQPPFLGPPCAAPRFLVDSPRPSSSCPCPPQCWGGRCPPIQTLSEEQEPPAENGQGQPRGCGPTLPLLHRALLGLHALVVGLRLGLVVRVVVLAEVGVCQSLGRADPLVTVQHQHPAQEVHSCRDGGAKSAPPLGPSVEPHPSPWPVLTQGVGSAEDAPEVLLGHGGHSLKRTKSLLPPISKCQLRRHFSDYLHPQETLKNLRTKRSESSNTVCSLSFLKWPFG